MGDQHRFASIARSAKGKVTRREHILAKMDGVIPWPRLLRLLEPHYPKGRQAGLEKMLRVSYLFGCFLLFSPASLFAWGNEGHEIVAYIAAAHLDDSARKHIAEILNVSSDPDSVADAMAKQSTRPDDPFRSQDRSTAPWHFIDICLQDTKADIDKRCNNDCVTRKIDDYEQRLKKSDYDKWGAEGDLTFLIHFMGDIHQPLHDATNADKGANCIRVNPQRSSDDNLHRTWDTTLVQELEKRNKAALGPRGAKATAQAVDAHYQANPPSQELTWKDGEVNDIAWESTQVARTQIYQKLDLKKEVCEEVHNCETEAPHEVNSEIAELDPQYISEATDLAGRQLYIAGMRLASLLNQIWP